MNLVKIIEIYKKICYDPDRGFVMFIFGNCSAMGNETG